MVYYAVVELCCGLCRNVETPESSHASINEHATKAVDRDDVKQSKVTEDKEQTASVLSKYVNVEPLIC